MIARDFDARGPDVCLAEIVTQLEQHNPEFLDIAVKCAADSGSPRKVLVSFSMFYRLLVVHLPADASDPPLFAPPRVSAETRGLLVAEIDEMGAEAFIAKAIAELQESNPELLQMAHNFAAGLENYLHVMQGFALLYNDIRTHRSLNKDSPVSRPVQRTGIIHSHALLGGLHHYYARV